MNEDDSQEQGRKVGHGHRWGQRGGLKEEASSSLLPPGGAERETLVGMKTVLLGGRCVPLIKKSSR